MSLSDLDKFDHAILRVMAADGRISVTIWRGRSACQNRRHKRDCGGWRNWV